MKSKRILWRNSSVLYAEHLNKLCDLLEDSSGYIFSKTQRFSYGIDVLKIDEMALSTGILSISYVEGILPDGTVFMYDTQTKNYPLSINLTSFSEELFYTAKKFYLCKDHENFEENKQIISATEEIVPVTYGEPKLKIVEQLPNENGFPIAEIFIKGGAFNLREFYPPVLSVKKSSPMGNSLSKFIIFLRQAILGIKDQIIINNAENLKGLLKDLNESLVKININFINELPPFSLYLSLCECVGKISWNSLLMPNVPPYDHNHSYYVIQKLLLLITEIITSNRTGYERLEMRKFGDVFSIMIPEIGQEDALLVIEPNNDEMRKWIENTVISSKSFFDDFKTRRFPGISREVVDDTSTELVVKLDKMSPYFSAGEELIIFSGNYKQINCISFYFKKSL